MPGSRLALQTPTSESWATKEAVPLAIYLKEHLPRLQGEIFEAWKPRSDSLRAERTKLVDVYTG
jgi:hypothetical protein